MPQYGKGYIKTPIGILKIIEIILCIVVIVLETDLGGYADLLHATLGAGVTGLVISLLIFILSLACGNDVNDVLQWQCVIHFVLTVWFLVCGIMLILKDWGQKVLIIAIMAIVTGVVYLLDTIFSYKEYKPF